MDLIPFSDYVILAYLSNTIAKVTVAMISTSPRQTKTRNQVSSGVGVLLAITTKKNILTDLGLITFIPIAGYIITGLLIGQGAKFVYEEFIRPHRPF